MALSSNVIDIPNTWHVALYFYPRFAKQTKSYCSFGADYLSAEVVSHLLGRDRHWLSFH